jgi:large subunit ribosomal protein L3
MQGILGQKVGMTAIFQPDGTQIAVTVVRLTGNIVVDKRTEERNGYTALVLGFGEVRVKRVAKPQIGFFQKQNLVEERDGTEYVKRHLREFRVSMDQLDRFEVGATIAGGDIFRAGEKIDVVGTSKGRGFTGVMQRHNFRGAKASHGVHEYFRHGGSIGSNTSPAHVFKNRKMPGQHGNKRRTVQNVTLIRFSEDGELALVRGGLPGPNGGIVMLQKSVKRPG